jgi:hypothetical protein
MSTQIRTGVIRVEVGDNNHYIILTISPFFSSSFFTIFNNRPIGIEPIFSVSKTGVLTIIRRTKPIKF